MNKYGIGKRTMSGPAAKITKNFHLPVPTHFLNKGGQHIVKVPQQERPPDRNVVSQAEKPFVMPRENKVASRKNKVGP